MGGRCLHGKEGGRCVGWGGEGGVCCMHMCGGRRGRCVLHAHVWREEREVCVACTCVEGGREGGVCCMHMCEGGVSCMHMHV